MNESDYAEKLADLVVRLGANVQPGQIVAISSEPGKEALTRAIAEAAYRAGALFVDLSVFDVYLKRARAVHADRETLGFVPPWLGERALALGEHRCARVALTGPVAPRIMDGIDPGLLGLDMLPSLREGMSVINKRLTNWTVAPCPTTGWATLVHPRLEPPQALDRLWQQVAHVCRIDEDDPVAAWQARLDQLLTVSAKLDELRLDALRFRGPGTDLTIGLFASSHWCAARFETAGGIVHVPNLPTEEVFTTPDPERVQGFVTSTKPLFTSGTTITGLKVRFEAGRAVQIEADQGADVLRSLSERDPGAARLGEVALVDREGRIGPLETTFFDTLLDENAASHIALGQGYDLGVTDEDEIARINESEIHVDFMIGSDELEVDGVRQDGSEIPLLRGGSWQI
ncbi:MAG TPA: aminopeptidase [Solirubrobacteraceae bacterium]